MIVGFGPERPALEAQAASLGVGALHRAARAPAPAPPARRSPTPASCRRSSPRPSAWSPPRRRQPAARPSSRGTPASRRSRRGWRRRSRPRSGGWSALPPANAPELRERLKALFALPAADRARLRTTVRAVAEARWSWAGIAQRLLELSCREPLSTGRLAFRARWANRTTRRTTELLARGPRALRRGGGLHRLGRGGVRAARPRDARPRQPLRGRPGGRPGHVARATPRRRADRVGGGGQDRAGRRRSRTSPPRSPSGAPQLAALVEPLGLALGATGTHPWASWTRPADHRHAALPAKRRDPPLRRLAEQHVRPPRPRRRSAGPTGRSRSRRRSATGSRSCSPSRPARPSLEGVDTGLHSARTQVFTRFFPRCGVPDALRLVGRAGGLRPLSLRDGLDRRADAALVERPPAPRVPHGRDPHLRRPAGSRRGAVARRADGRRSRRAARGRSTRASRSPSSRTG